MHARARHQSLRRVDGRLQRARYLYARGAGVPKFPARSRALPTSVQRKEHAWLLNLELCTSAERASRDPDAPGALPESVRENAAVGCFNLGVSYDEGNGGAQDFQRARELYQKACDGEDMTGCAGLGRLYALGQGGARDYQRAQELYRKACDRGELLGCRFLGSLYVDGQGGAKDSTPACSSKKHAMEETWCPAATGTLYAQGRDALKTSRERGNLRGATADPCGAANGALYMRGPGQLARARRSLKRREHDEM